MISNQSSLPFPDMQLVIRVKLMLLLAIVVTEEIGVRVDLGLELIVSVLTKEHVEGLNVKAVHFDAFVDWSNGGVREGN